MYSSLRKSPGDVGNGSVSLNNCVQEIKVPNDFETEVRKRGAEREKVDDGFHAKLPLSDYGATA